MSGSSACMCRVFVWGMSMGDTQASPHFSLSRLLSRSRFREEVDHCVFLVSCFLACLSGAGGAWVLFFSVEDVARLRRAWKRFAGRHLHQASRRSRERLRNFHQLG